MDIEKAYNLCKTSIIQNAWDQRQEVHVHGWVYGLGDGQIRDLGVMISGREDVDKIYKFDLKVD